MEAQNEAFAIEKETLAQEVTKAKEVLDGHKAKASTLERLMYQLQGEKSSLTEELEAARINEENRTRDFEAHKTQADSLELRESEIAILRDEVEALKTEAEKDKKALDDELEAATVKLTKAENELAQSMEQIATLDTQKNELMKSFNDLSTDHSNMSNEVESMRGKAKEMELLSVKFDATTEALNGVREELKESKELCEGHQSTILELTKEKDRLVDEQSALNESKGGVARELEDLKADRSGLVENLSHRIVQLETERDVAAKALDNLRTEIESKNVAWQTKVDGLRADNKAIQEDHGRKLENVLTELDQHKTTAARHIEELSPLAEEKDELLTSIQTLRTENNRLQEEMKDAKSQAESVEREGALLSQELHETIEEYRAAAGSMEVQVTALRKENESLMEEKENVTAENASLSEEIKTVNLQADVISKELHELLDEHKASAEALEAELSELRVEREIHLAKLASLEEKLSDTLLRNDSLSEEIVTVKSQAQEIEKEGEMLTRELDDFSQEYKSLAESREREINALKAERSRLLDQVKQLQDEFEELQQMTEETEENQEELLLSFQREREELRRERDQCKIHSQTLQGELQVLKQEVNVLEQELSSNRLKTESHVSELRGLTYSNDSLTAEVETLRHKDEYHRDLMADLSTELSFSTSRENKLQGEVEQLEDRSIGEEITIPSLESRDRDTSFDIDHFHKELEESAVREAMLQCEIADVKGETDALREKARAEQAVEEFSRIFDENGTVLSTDDQVDISSIMSPSDEVQIDTLQVIIDDGTNTRDGEDAAVDKKDTSSQCPIQ
ncbi:MAG: hypothetical protein SGARI_000371 [Bacillariaceae sp.]